MFLQADHAGYEIAMRTVRLRHPRRGRRVHLQLRMHVLRVVRAMVPVALPELHRRTGAETAARDGRREGSGGAAGVTYSAFNSPHDAITASYGFPTCPFGWSHDFCTIGQ